MLGALVDRLQPRIVTRDAINHPTHFVAGLLFRGVALLVRWILLDPCPSRQWKTELPLWKIA